MSGAAGASSRHDEAVELIPWLVNGRLAPQERERLKRHLAECEDCRREVEAERRLRKAIRRDNSKVEYAPHASFQKLWLRIEESSRDAAPVAGIDRVDPATGAPSQAAGEWDRRRRWAIAAATIAAVGLGLLASSQWPALSKGPGSEYRTAATAPLQPDRAGQIRVVFSPGVTVEELTRIASETRLTIVGGPSESGVYTLAVQPGQRLPVGDAVARLRGDPRVRFAEPVIAAPRGSQ